MKVTVTQDHINRGICFSERSCPIALALTESPKIQCAYVFGPFARVYKEDWTRKLYALPNVARTFIDRFDFGHLVEPFEFEMTELKL